MLEAPDVQRCMLIPRNKLWPFVPAMAPAAASRKAGATCVVCEAMQPRASPGKTKQLFAWAATSCRPCVVSA
eukprot:scaffold264424_cov20-Tisochrysis_lutea.AAC.1